MMKKKIMMVDDEPDQILAVKLILEDLSDEYEVIGADSGMQCLELLENNQIPDLIFLDIMMPGMNGWQVFAKLKDNPEWREIPIVFLTAKTDVYSMGFGKLSADDYIEKPFEITDLKRRVDKVLKD